MRLSQPIFYSPGFQFASSNELLRALDGHCSPEELANINVLFEQGVPVVTSRLVLATLLGVNPGLIWSFQYKTSHYYRIFSIPKGQGKREIQAPKVALKLIQKWLATVFSSTLQFQDHVFGFVSGRSHIDAAIEHVGAHWVFGVDIRDFFRSTPQQLVQSKLQELGYPINGACLLASITCLHGFLAQGSPASPVISNLCFTEWDIKLKALADKHNCRMTRYADDIVFSGVGTCPAELHSDVKEVIDSSPWRLAPEKIEAHALPHRLKVHGLLVDGMTPRLTKGYRNKLRAFKHMLLRADISPDDRARLSGHVSYSKHVVQRIQTKLLPPTANAEVTCQLLV